MCSGSVLPQCCIAAYLQHDGETIVLQTKVVRKQWNDRHIAGARVFVWQSTTTKESAASKSLPKVSGRKTACPTGAVKLIIDVLDPSPKGHCLEDEVPVRLAEDCPAFADFSILEEPGIAFFSDPKGSVRVHRHLVVLIVQERRASGVFGHMRAYCETVLEDHPIMLGIQAVNFVG